MKKIDFVREFAANADLSMKDAKEIMQVMGDTIVAHMKDEDGVCPFAGMKFVAVYKDARKTRNPQTGEMMTVPAKYAPRVRFGKAVKEAIN